MTQPTEKQVEWLNKKGITVPETKEEATKLLDEAFKSGSKSSSNKGGYSPKPQQQTIEVVTSTADVDEECQKILDTCAAQADAFMKRRWPKLNPGEYQYEIKFGMIFNNVCQKYL